VDEFRKVSGDTHTASRGLDDLIELDRIGARFLGSIACSATAAVPRSRHSRGRGHQQARNVSSACTDMSIRDTVLEVRPIFMIRPADETGWSRTGGDETFGFACAWVSRSCTI
jgi:hypothetical protein